MDERDGAADKRLGMDRPIARRDFLNGIALTALGLSAATPAAAFPQDTSAYYPPVLTGMRGSHPGSFEMAHSLRDGTFWKSAPPPVPGEDSYDLVIVGGGISGLAAAHFYRTQKPASRILILDNHDDFGGHAKRNEFAIGGRTELINGGTLEIDSPRPYSKISDSLIRLLGIDPEAFEARFAKKDFYKSLGLGHGVFFDKETFGADKLVAGIGEKPWKDVLDKAPLSDRVRADIIRIEEAEIDYMPGLTSAEKKTRLSRISYKNYLLDIVKADPGVIPFYQTSTVDEWGVGIDAITALDVWGFYGNSLGFQGLKLEPGSVPHMGNTPSGYADGGSYTFHFPDGNASIARLLVRKLIPAAIPGKTAEDIVLAQADYSQLDKPGQPVRIRLSSIVVGARNLGDPAKPDGVEIAYTRLGEVFRVRAQNCILASWNMMIPYICPELPQKQKEALHYLVKVPLIYTSVSIANWRAFEKLGVSEIYAPGSYHSRLRLNPTVDIGGYTSVRSPDDPIIVRMERVPTTPGLDERQQHRLGHANILGTSFETFERNIRDQLQRTLAPGGFDAARDIMAVTVNRWPHGYAYEYNPLFDPDWPPGQAPHEIGRARFGRIAIANSDSGAAAYTDCAIDQAHRAVKELLVIT
jgi:spermidine dehydrogenase